MSYWDRLRAYLSSRPEATGRLEMLPTDRFRTIVARSANEVFGVRGWTREGELTWVSECQLPGAARVFEFRPLKGGGLAARWGLRLPFLPALSRKTSRLGDESGTGRPLDLSYDPLDYERSVAAWTLSRFATESEVHEQAQAITARALPLLESMAGCCSDFHSLLGCFEAKRDRKYVRFGFSNYPQEVLAYGGVLGLVGRRGEGLAQIDEALEAARLPDNKRERIKRLVIAVWDAPLPEASQDARRQTRESI